MEYVPNSAHFAPRRAGVSHLSGVINFLMMWFLIAYFGIDRFLLTTRTSESEIRDVSELDQYATFQIAVTLVLAVLVFARLVLRNAYRESFPQLKFFKAPLWPWTMFLALGASSIAWSEYPALSAFKIAQVLVFSVAIIDVMGSFSTFERAVRFLVMFALVYIGVCYYVYIDIIVPQQGVSIDTLHYVVSHAPFAWLPFLVLASGVSTWQKKGYLYIFALVFLVETVFTSFGAVMLGALVYAWTISSVRGKQLFIPLAVLAVVLSFVFLFMLEGSALLGLKSQEELLSGTGRFEVWIFALTEVFAKQPLLGYAFPMGDLTARVVGGFSLGQLHNAHLSALLNLGLLGFFFWVLFLVLVVRSVLDTPERKRRAGLLAALCAILVHQFFGGASLSSALHVNWIAHVIFVCVVIFHRKDVRA